MKQRETKILEILTKKKRMPVRTLAEEMGVSQVTARKDLAKLEEKGIIARAHGMAMLASGVDLNSRLAYHYETKKRIASQGVQLVQDGETIMIESGSCCALFAEALVLGRRDVTIITNSAFIAGYIRKKPGAQVILLGGAYQNDAQVMVGPLVAQCARHFCVDKLFIGTDGYRKETGFTNSDYLRAKAVRDMAARVGQVIVLTEGEKFSHRGVVPLELDQQVHQVITDASIPEETKAHLESQGMLVHLAES